ncbi:hypothetical protein CLOP_g3971 [Closterium sp. NIES-67]|nr:hypothetical protein CLOP_g3971 [Closterium sp. NIES-67]
MDKEVEAQRPNVPGAVHAQENGIVNATKEKIPALSKVIDDVEGPLAPEDPDKPAADNGAADGSEPQEEQELVGYIGAANGAYILADYGRDADAFREALPKALENLPRHFAQYSMGYGRLFVLFQRHHPGLVLVLLGYNPLPKAHAQTLLGSVAGPLAAATGVTITPYSASAPHAAGKWKGGLAGAEREKLSAALAALAGGLRGVVGSTMACMKRVVSRW